MLEEDVKNPKIDFEAKMLKIVQDDFANAKTFMDKYHRGLVDFYKFYHNAKEYQDLKKKDKFPMPFIQEQVDEFVADNMDTLYYKNRPCNMMGVEESDKEDAEVKQKMLDWQDYKDKIYQKTKTFLRDAALYAMPICQIDYVERFQTKVVGEDRPQQRINEFGEVETLMDDNG